MAELPPSLSYETAALDLAATYRSRFFDAGLKRRERVWKILCEAFFQRYIPEDSTVLELACGYGEFINNIRAEVKLGIDLNPDSPTHLASEIRFWNGSATDLSFIADGSVDRVFTSNFLEHLPTKQDCTRVFGEVLRVLKPGGLFLILGPNIRYAYREYWDFYDHYLPLSHLSLSEGLKVNGFEIDVCIPRFLPYTMAGSQPTHALLIRAYLLMPIAWKLLGKQFFVVARRSPEQRISQKAVRA
jgi:SAM-dependent methyltransferase